jgi:hypothetical protein
VTKHLAKKPFLTLMIGLALVGGCRRDAGSSGSADVKVERVPANSLVRDWAIDLNVHGERPTSIDLREKAVYVETTGSTYLGVDRGAGDVVFAQKITRKDAQVRPPIVMEDKIVFPTNTTLEIFDKRGRRIQSIRLPFATSSAGIGSGKNFIYIGADYKSGGRLAKLDLSFAYPPESANPTITPRWEAMTNGVISAAPVLFEDSLYYASEDGRVYAINESRAIIWPLANSAFQTEGRIVADLKVDPYGVYVASTDSKLYVLDRSNGKVKWQYYAQTALNHAPAVTKDRVYQYVHGRGLVALDKDDGEFNRKPLWIAGDGIQLLAEDGKYAYVRNNRNQIMALDVKTGQMKFKSKRRDFKVFATNTESAIIYASTAAGNLYAIKPVLTEGTVGELVLDVRPMEIASNQ